MSLPRDLDEVPGHELRAEIERRSVARARGVCDYCGRDPSETACKFPERHRASAKRKRCGYCDSDPCALFCRG
jgi:hypothetical protein